MSALTREHADDAPACRSSWWPVDLSVVDTKPTPPTILRRTDGVALLYPGRIHWAQGESESHKSWAAAVAVAEQLEAGQRAAYVDFEDDSANLVERLVALGVSRDALRDPHRFRYVHPEEPLYDRHGKATVAAADLEESLVEWQPVLVVLDGVTEAMQLDGLDPLSNVEFAAWRRRLPHRLSTFGRSAVFAIDHVVKSTENRGRYAMGAVHKLNGVTGAAYSFEAIRHLGRPRLDPVEGLVRISLQKDRPGYLRGLGIGTGQPVADLHLTAWPDATIGWRLEPPGGEGDLGIRRRIAETLRVYPASTKTALRAIGNSDAIDRALVAMVTAGHVSVEPKGRSHLHTLTSAGENAYPEEAE